MAEERAKIRIYPISRTVLPGAISKYEVEVEGAVETTINVTSSLFGIYGRYIGFPWHFTKGAEEHKEEK